MRIFAAITDQDWFSYLADSQPDEVNFWRPSGTRFAALGHLEPFLFKPKGHVNRIAGGGFFVTYLSLPLSMAWDVFEYKNGADDYETFRRSVLRHRRGPTAFDPEIGCIVISQPVFLDLEDWIDVPDDWSANIQMGKTYRTEEKVGADLWRRFQDACQYTRLRRAPIGEQAEVAEGPRHGNAYLTRARLGQGAFRSLVIDAYHRRCAITGERTLPALQASHIKPFTASGPHRVDNGVLLRADLHILFDRGYVTVTEDYRVEVSPRIKEAYENGRDYYAMHGARLQVLPAREPDRPSREFLAWHNENVYLP